MSNLFSALAALSKCTLLLGVAARPSPYRKLVFLPIAAICSYCYSSRVCEDSIRIQVLLDLLTASDFILLTDVQRELRQIGQRESISSFGAWNRLKWAFQLGLSPRGVGWMHEPKSILPPHPTHTRLEFLWSRFISLLQVLIFMDVALFLSSIDPGFSTHAPLFHHQPLLWRFWATALFFLKMRLALTIGHIVCSMMCVGTGISEPSSWPEFFGKWGDAYTIRRFWGRMWHQQLRRIFSVHGKFLAHRVFCFPPGSNASSYTQLYVAFLLSSIIHIVSFDLRPCQFFLTQAVVITVEDAIIAVAQKYTERKVFMPFRVLGYMWVYCTLVLTLGPWFDSMHATGANGSTGKSVLGLLRDRWLLGR